MVLACLLDLGADLKKIRASLVKTLGDRFEIKAMQVRQGGFRGTRLKVRIAHHGHDHHHPPSLKLRRVPQRFIPSVPDCHGMLHRNLGDIEKLISAGRLSPFVKEQAISVFRRLAGAEARVHGVKPSEIHFHEVGAMDSIIDIVGACIALELTGADKIAVGPLPLGCGTIKCAHGILPSPAPATVELLKGFSIEQTGEPFELVTPTGAALLTTWQNINRVPAGSEIIRTGYGFGNFELHARPNLLRATLFESAEKPAGNDQCLVLECNLDDMAPELTGFLFNRLLERGALDVFLTPVQMKKNRPGAMLTVLCSPDQREEMLDLIFRESTTFGVREHIVRRTILPRRFETVKTPYGKVRLKTGSWNGMEITRAPEYEDCRKLAEKTGVPLRRIYEAALAAGGKHNRG
jgi:hypothetical protein